MFVHSFIHTSFIARSFSFLFDPSFGNCTFEIGWKSKRRCTKNDDRKFYILVSSSG